MGKAFQFVAVAPSCRNNRKRRLPGNGRLTMLHYFLVRAGTCIAHPQLGPAGIGAAWAISPCTFLEEHGFNCVENNKKIESQREIFQIIEVILQLSQRVLD